MGTALVVLVWGYSLWFLASWRAARNTALVFVACMAFFDAGKEIEASVRSRLATFVLDVSKLSLDDFLTNLDFLILVCYNLRDTFYRKFFVYLIETFLIDLAFLRKVFAYFLNLGVASDYLVIVICACALNLAYFALKVLWRREVCFTCLGVHFNFKWRESYNRHEFLLCVNEIKISIFKYFSMDVPSVHIDCANRVNVYNSERVTVEDSANVKVSNAQQCEVSHTQTGRIRDTNTVFVANSPATYVDRGESVSVRETPNVLVDNGMVRRIDSGERVVEENSQPLCIVCRDRPIDSLIDGCFHLCLCRECGEELLNDYRPCPLCRHPIRRLTRVYISSSA